MAASIPAPTEASAWVEIARPDEGQQVAAPRSQCSPGALAKRERRQGSGGIFFPQALQRLARAVAGEGDRICPPDHAERLRVHWDGCAIHWFPGGHLAQVGRGAGFRAVRRLLVDTGVL